MKQSNNLTATNSHFRLLEHYEEVRNAHLKNLFREDSKRFNKFSLQFNDIFFDYSKNRITEKTMVLLLDLAKERLLDWEIKHLFEGQKINKTENRAVLHVALRHQGDTFIVDGQNIKQDIDKVKDKMKFFSDRIRNGDWLGFSNKKITDVVNIGIGGSDLGPKMVCEALKPFAKPTLKVHFVSNIDGSDISECLQELNPETTLFLVASKTFTTQETMTNAETAKKWLCDQSKNVSSVSKHFVALSVNIEKAVSFGIDAENVFEFWDWVGGRFSLWGAMGLSICCAVGYTNFEKLLQGAYDMDMHFRNAPYAENIPVLMALLGIWYTNYFNCSTQAILPYDQHLHRFSAYLQQGEMESNGKSINCDGLPIPYQTNPVIWGEPGTNGQHAFYQLLHQGTQLVPCDFIAAANPINIVGDHHEKLLSNFFAQTEALMMGKAHAEVAEELKSTNMDNKEVSFQIPFRVFEGNKPSTSILLKQLTPENLGSLIAMYEHKIFVQGVLWNVFSFDQWGVELGKQKAGKILPELNAGKVSGTHDSSTTGLIEKYLNFRT